MDHAFRGHRQGLIIIGEVSQRPSREEFKVYVDAFAKEAIRLFVPSTLQYELDGWARSYYDLQKHIDAIEAYGISKLPEPSDEVWNQTKQHTLNLFRSYPHVVPTSYKNFDDVKWISSSSAGYGYTGHKGDPGNYSRAKKIAVTIAEKLDHERGYGPQAIKDSTPDIAFTRTQLSQVKVKSKVRNVWGEAFHYVLLEGLFADPLIAKFKELDSFYFIGQNPLLAVPPLIESMLNSKDYVYMLDWSGFDASVQEWEIRLAFECLTTMLSFPSNVEKQIWLFIIELFIYRKIAGPQGVLYLKTQGIPSGSCFTNIIGSITNYIRIQYMISRLSGRRALVFTHGDDSLVGVDAIQYVPMNRLQEVCLPLNWNISPTKSSVSMKNESITFLSRTVRERQNARDELVCLRMLLYPEYPVTEGSISALRAQSISLDAGVNSHYLYLIFQYLKEKYGVAQSLPLQLQRWDPIEFETRRTSASNFM